MWKNILLRMNWRGRVCICFRVRGLKEEEIKFICDTIEEIKGELKP